MDEEKIYCSMYSRNAELYHHGIKGQKWGVQNGPPYPLDSDVSTGKRLKNNESDQSKTAEYFREIKKEEELMKKNIKNLVHWGSYDYDFNGLHVIAKRADNYKYNKKTQKFDYKDFIVDSKTSLERRKREEAAFKKLNEKDVLTQLYKDEIKWNGFIENTTLDDFLKGTQITHAYIGYLNNGSDMVIEFGTNWFKDGHIYNFEWNPETKKISNITYNG